MPVDNTIYDRRAGEWWSDDALPAVLRIGYNPARFAYLRRVIAEAGVDPVGKRALDVGCGGGLLAEEVARLGCRVTGVDPSAASVQVARDHAAANGLRIDYLVAAGERLPLADATYDLAYCCDVLEHVADLDRVVAETARVLRPGGLYVFDTINRTFRSWLAAIKVAQEWKPTRFMEPDLHAWPQFVKPRELRRLLTTHHLIPGPFVGLSPAPGPLSAIRLMRRRARGDLTYAGFARGLAIRESGDLSISYAGYAVKA